jgi:hypothetical protein
VDPIRDPQLRRKLGSAGNRTQDLWLSSQKLWPLDHKGGLQWLAVAGENYYACHLLITCCKEPYG